MSVVLFVNEFGGGLGHLNRLLAIAKYLAQDARLVFALPSPLRTGQVIRALGKTVEVTRGVTWTGPPHPNARKVPTDSLADVFVLFGFHRMDNLNDAGARWLKILDQVRPTLVVADFPPSLRLAADRTVPMVVVGNGYTIPPSGRVLPPLRPWHKSVPARSRAHEARLLETINAYRARRRGAAIDFFADLFSGDRTFVCTFPEFDPYDAYRTEAPIPPFNIPELQPGPPVSERTGAIFAYCPSYHPAIAALIEALSAVELPSELYVGSALPPAIKEKGGTRLTIRSEPADYAEVLPSARLLIHHGGLGTAYAGIAAGVPQLVLPLSLEHLITAKQTERVGACITLSAQQALNPNAIKETILRLLSDTSSHVAAANGARNLLRLRSAEPGEVIAHACRAILTANSGA